MPSVFMGKNQLTPSTSSLLPKRPGGRVSATGDYWQETNFFLSYCVAVVIFSPTAREGYTASTYTVDVQKFFLDSESLFFISSLV